MCRNNSKNPVVLMAVFLLNYLTPKKCGEIPSSTPYTSIRTPMMQTNKLLTNFLFPHFLGHRTCYEPVSPSRNQFYSIPTSH